MGLTELFLVDPVNYPNMKAQALASNAADILDTAVVVPDLDAAIADCHLVVGTSARSRTIPWPMLTPRELGEKAAQESRLGKVAIVFGREQSGLTNEELQRCHFHVHIPSNPEYCSLNLAAAVQVIGYELRLSCLANEAAPQPWDYPIATAKEMEGFYAHLEAVMIEIDFLKPDVPRQLMPRLRRLFNRARLDVMEMNIMRGIFGAISRSLLASRNNDHPDRESTL